jgi:hypothetical protein
MTTGTTVHTQGFWAELREQRWDDHRYYHQSYVNQALHLLSALSFLTTFVLLAVHPVAAAIFGWIIAMWARQIGHFFFEPKGFDHVNQATHEHKEEIKVGYNLQRKVALLTAWAALPVVLWLDPTLFGVFDASAGWDAWVHKVSQAWIVLGVFAVLARTLWLCATRNLQTGVVWATKILTDPLHDIKLYHKAPLHLLKGEWIDPMDDVTGKQTTGR